MLLSEHQFTLVVLSLYLLSLYTFDNRLIQSKWLKNLDARLREGESISTVSGDLAQLSGLQPLLGGDLRLATKMLKHMAERMNYDIQVGMIGAYYAST